ncbi:MAG: response regulator [Lachnospiraceae bacterium]|nr:response regulator [Lachnospiraceae bacterium]
MGKRVLIISSTETFTVRGLAMKLKGLGLDAEYSAPKVDAVEPVGDVTDLFILYTDDAMEKGKGVFAYIKDQCISKGKHVVVIGTKTEYEIVTKSIPESFIYKFFERPLDMEEFLDEMDEFFKGDSSREKKKNILIVDDDASYMTMIYEWLKDIYRVSLADSGKQAMETLAKNRPDLILLDYEMPETSGPQVLKMIKADPNTADIPVIFLTGMSDKENIMKVLSLKPAGYLLKSIKKTDLRENIAAYFAKHI